MTQLADWQVYLAWTVFTFTYGVLALGYVPWFRLDRTGAAFVGAVAMVAGGILTEEQAFRAQDHETLVLLFSMMIVVSFLMNSGILGRLREAMLEGGHQPQRLLWMVVGLSGGLSALFINDIVCLVLTPMVLYCCRRRGYLPMPHLLGLAMGSNLGSMMTPVGNPQNIYIASVGKIGYADFVLAMAPVSLLGLVLLAWILQRMYQGRWLEEHPPESTPAEPSSPIVPYVLVRTLVVLGMILVAFWWGAPLATVAAAGAAFLMVTRRIRRQQLFSLIDWDLLVLFVSLFVLTEAARLAHILDRVYAALSFLDLENGLAVSALTLVFSNLFSNVPAVFFLSQFVARLADPQQGYLLMAMISTLAGNLTLVGSIANLIVAEKARPSVVIDFWSYTRVGAPVTLLTMTFGLLYWHLRFGL